MRRIALVTALALAAACANRSGGGPAATPTPVPSPSSTGTPPPGCQTLTGVSTLPIAVAPSAGEFALTLPVTTDSHTTWAVAGNEALILEVNGASG
ncbi:MAG TPA: hypothetical protein VMV18_11015, partial [bacterium]|nr:hypothetical protein [bacterium]